MKRDMGIIRAILLAVEARTLESMEGDASTMRAHLAMALQGGLLHRETGSDIVLTWDGREFLDLARSDAVWERTSERILSKLSSAPIDVWKDTLRAEAVAELNAGVEAEGEPPNADPDNGRRVMFSLSADSQVIVTSGGVEIELPAYADPRRVNLYAGQTLVARIGNGSQGLVTLGADGKIRGMMRAPPGVRYVLADADARLAARAP